MARMLCMLPVLFATGCTGDSDVVRVGSFLFSSLTGSNTKIPRERAAAVPYATMGLELGASAQALLTLGSTMEDELDWFAGENVFVATKHGRVIRTVGLPYDLGGIRRINTPFQNHSPDTTRTLSSMDFPDLGIFGATAQCSSTDRGNDSVEILGASIPTRHIVERCEVQAMRWKFDNDFWEDRTSGYVWRSRQYIHPKSPPIILEVLRPEQNATNEGSARPASRGVP